MKGNEFDKIVEAQFNLCGAMLFNKAKEYATEDRLHNFKTAAALQGVTPMEALSGMMAKHTVSVYDMMQSEESFTIAQWTEKISDHINYLLLLKAIVIEESRTTRKTRSPRE